MSRDPGRLQRAIIELIESSGPGDVGWTTSWLCEHVYRGKSSKSQRTALIRAIKKMRLPIGWKFERGWDELHVPLTLKSGQRRSPADPSRQMPLLNARRVLNDDRRRSLGIIGTSTYARRPRI
jgi:hypothetical protein